MCREWEFAMVEACDHLLSDVLEAKLRDLGAQAVDVNAELAARKPASSRFFFANTESCSGGNFVRDRSLNDDHSIVVCDDHITGFNKCACAYHRNVHRTECGLNCPLRTDGAAPDGEFHFCQVSDVTTSCVDHQPFHAMRAQRSS